jgi:hypothetical protein
MISSQNIGRTFLCCIHLLFVLDPRAKRRGFHKALTLISILTSNDYATYFDSIQAEFTTVFTKYDLMFGGQVSHRKHVPVAGSRKKRKAWGKIYGSNVVGGSDPSPTPKPFTPQPSLLFESQSELLSYLDTDPVSEYDDDFSILSW